MKTPSARRHPDAVCVPCLASGGTQGPPKPRGSLEPSKHTVTQLDRPSPRHAQAVPVSSACHDASWSREAQGPSTQPRPTGCLLWRPPKTSSGPTLCLHLQPWSCTWDHQVLWCPPVDICSNSTSQAFLLVQPKQPPGAPWALANMLVGLPSSPGLKYQDVPCQVGCDSRRGFQSPEATRPQATVFQPPGLVTHQVLTAFLPFEICLPLGIYPCWCAYMHLWTFP